MSSSTDNPLGTVGSFQRFPRSELNFESMQLEDDLAPSPVNSSNIWCKAWKFVWRVVAATLVLILLGYGLNQLANSGMVPSNASTAAIPMPVWSAENSTILPETSPSMQETTPILLESTTISMEATTSKTMEPSTEFPLSMTTVEPTTLRGIKLDSITPSYPLATDSFTTSSATTVVPSTGKRRLQAWPFGRQFMRSNTWRSNLQRGQLAVLLLSQARISMEQNSMGIRIRLFSKHLCVQLLRQQVQTSLC